MQLTLTIVNIYLKEQIKIISFYVLLAIRIMLIVILNEKEIYIALHYLLSRYGAQQEIGPVL